MSIKATFHSEVAYTDYMAKGLNTNRKQLIGIGVLFIILLPLGLLLYSRFGVFTPPATIHLQNMKLYTDPDKYFSVDMPLSWSVDHQVGTITTGSDNDHLNPYDVEMFAFMSKPVNYSEPNDAIILFVEVWRNGQCLDTDTFTSNTTLAGMPAYYDGTSMYELDTSTASIRLYEHVWGIDEKNPSQLEINPGGPLYPPPTPVIPPQNVIAQNRKFLDAIVRTLKPVSTTPASCAKGE